MFHAACLKSSECFFALVSLHTPLMKMLGIGASGQGSERPEVAYGRKCILGTPTHQMT